MSVDGIGGVRSIGAIVAAQATQTPASKPDAAAGPSDFFDMTGWTGPAEASVTTGPAAAKAALPELSASVLSAILR